MFAPFSVGINPLTHRGVIANESTNVATIIDLTTNPASVIQQVGGASNPVSTGATPQIAVDPILNWAVITPGGAGTISIVDLGQPASQGTGIRNPNLVATLTLTTTINGVGLNTETHQALLHRSGEHHRHHFQHARSVRHCHHLSKIADRRGRESAHESRPHHQ